MPRKKNSTTLTPFNKDRTVWTLRFIDDDGNKGRIVKSTTTILKALKHFEICPFTDDIKSIVGGGYMEKK